LLTDEPTVKLPTPTPEPIAPPLRSNLDFDPPSESGPFPLDLVVIDPENLNQLAPFREFSAAGIPSATSGASLAFLAPYENSLAAHLNDSRLIVWNIASGAVRFRDWYPSDGSQFLENPALAISPAYQGYLATTTTTAAEGDAGRTRAFVLRPPGGRQEFFLHTDAGLEDDATRVMSLAFSPDGHLLAASIGTWHSGVIQIWDIWDRDERRLIQEIAFDEGVGALQFSPDGSALTIAIGDALVSLDPNDGTELLRKSFGFPIRGYSRSSSGESFAIWDSNIAVLEAPGLEAPLKITANNEIRQTAFSPDEQLAVLADGGQLRFWDLATGVELTSAQGRYEYLDVAFFDNGRVLASIDANGRVSLWGVPGGFELQQNMARISSANAGLLERAARLYIPESFKTLFSSNTDLLAVGSAQGVYLIDLPTLQLRRLLAQDDLGYTEFDASENFDELAWVSDAGAVKVWDVWQDRLDREIVIPGKQCCVRVLLTPDGNYLITLADSTVRLWHLPTGGEIYARDNVQRVHISPDGTRLALESAVALEVTILDLKTGQDLRKLTGFTTAAPFYNTQFSPDWSTMVWGSRAYIEFTDVESGELGSGAPFSWGVFSPRDNRIAAVEDGWILDTVGQVHMIDVETGESVLVFDHHEDAIVDAVAFSPDGRLLATATEETVKLWDALNGKELVTLPRTDGSVSRLAFSPDRRMLLLMSEGDLIEFWVVPAEAVTTADIISMATVASVVPVDSLQLEEGATDAVFSPDESNIAISTQSGAIWYWDLASGQAIESVSSHEDWIYKLAYNSDGTTLASVSKDGHFREKRGPDWYGYAPDDHVGEISGVAFFPDGNTVVTSGQDGTLQIREKAYLSPTLIIDAHPAWVWDLAVSPAGDLLASASADRSIKLWQVELKPGGSPLVSPVRELTGHTATIYGLDFAPDGKSLASASWDGTVRMWDAASGDQQALLIGHTDWVYDVAFSPDGSLLASASADGTVRLWVVATGNLLATLGDAGSPIWSVAFSPDGRNLVSASHAGLVQIWRVVP
jgi:WD40 repeat protein